MAVVKEADRFVVEVDLYSTTTETEEPHEDGEPPGEPRTIAFLAIDPRLFLVGEFPRQHRRRHGGLGLSDSTELRRRGIRSTTGTVDGLDRGRPDIRGGARGGRKEWRSEGGDGLSPGKMGLGFLGHVSSNAIPVDVRRAGSGGRRVPLRATLERSVRRRQGIAIPETLGRRGTVGIGESPAATGKRIWVAGMGEEGEAEGGWGWARHVVVFVGHFLDVWISGRGRIFDTGDGFTQLIPTGFRQWRVRR